MRMRYTYAGITLIATVHCGLVIIILRGYIFVLEEGCCALPVTKYRTAARMTLLVAPPSPAAVDANDSQYNEQHTSAGASYDVGCVRGVRQLLCKQ